MGRKKRKQEPKEEGSYDINFEEVNLDIGGISELVLTTLQKSKVPIDINYLSEMVSVKQIGADRDSVKEAIRTLTLEGYDIKKITHGKNELYSLVRYSSVTDESLLYRMHGEIETPFILTSDWHVGSKGFYKMAFNQMVKDISTYDVTAVCVAGDIIQGRGVYSTELSELQMPALGDQIGYTIELLNELGDVDVHVISGNHEEKVQGSVYIGLDPIKLISNACSNTHYYGHVANLTLNKDYHYMMMHGSGAVSKATTAMVQKIWEGLRSKPNILHCGHAHQSAFVRQDVGKWAIMSGTLQRTNSWLIQKGHNAKIGWWIVNDINDLDTITLTERTVKLN